MTQHTVIAIHLILIEQKRLQLIVLEQIMVYHIWILKNNF